MNQKQNRRIPRWWNWEDILLILLLACTLYFPGIGRISLFDRDEPRFAEAAREMLNSGNFIVPRFDGVLRPDKPPVIYWLMDISYKIFGVSTMAARLPSVIFGSLTLLLVYWMAGRRFGRLTGLLAAMMLAVSALFFAETRLATADSVMIFFTTLTMGCLWSAWDAWNASRANTMPHPQVHNLANVENGSLLNEYPIAGGGGFSWKMAGLFWAAMAGGILTKGVTPIFVICTVLALGLLTGGLPAAWRQTGIKRLPTALPRLFAAAIFKGSWGWCKKLRPLRGLALLAVLICPWFAAAWIETRGKLIAEMLNQNLVQRTTSGLQHHGAPPGFYLAVIWATFWPWSVLLVPAGYHLLRRARGRTPIILDRTAYQFLLAWIVPAWLVFELIVTKMVQYVLPLFIPLAIICADTLVQSWHRMTDVLNAGWFAAARWVWMIIWIILGGGMLLATWKWLAPADGMEFRLIVPTGAALMAVGVAGAMSWNRPAWPFVTVFTFAIALLLADTVSLPAVRQLDISRRAGMDMRLLAQRGYHLAAAGYIEPTLVFYSGGNIQLFGGGPPLATKVPFASPGHPLAPNALKYAVVVNRRTLAWLKRHHFVFYLHTWFSGIQAARGRFVCISVITNVPRGLPAGNSVRTRPGTAPRQGGRHAAG